MKRPHARLFAIALSALVLTAVAQARLPDAPAVADPTAVTVPPEAIRAAGIRSLTAWTSRVGPDGDLGEGYRASSVSYDMRGNPLEQIAYDERGVVLQGIVNTYDGKGRLVESVSQEHTGEGDARTVFAYDGEWIVGTTAYRPDGSLLVTTHYDYDKDGNVVASLTEVPDADISQRMTFEYSPSGDVINTISYDSAGNVVATSETKNDSDGRPLEATAFLPDGTISTVTRYSYDSDGQLLDVTVRDAEGTVLQAASKVYDLDGLMVEVVVSNPPAGIEQRVVVEYDEAENRLTEQTYNKLGQLVSETRYAYEYHGDRDGTQD